MQDYQVKVEKKPKAEEIAKKQIYESNKLSQKEVIEKMCSVNEWLEE